MTERIAKPRIDDLVRQELEERLGSALAAGPGVPPPAAPGLATPPIRDLAAAAAALSPIERDELRERLGG